MKKFKLTKNSKVVNGITLHQIQALNDFSNVKKGDLGGWIEKEKNLSQEDSAWVSENALVYGDARVSRNARVSDNAQVYGDARVSRNAWVSGNARVYESAWVSGNARVYDNAQVYGDAEVYGDAWVYGDAEVSDTLVYGDERMGFIKRTDEREYREYLKLKDKFEK